MAGNSTLTFTDANFPQEVLQSAVPVLVDFWAPWCGPCLRLGPTIDALAAEYAGKVKIGKLNTDENQQMAIQYGISSIPAMLVFKGGEVVNKVVGAHPKDLIAGVLNDSLA
ncbi:MAG: thioredoxin [Planctomycetota bacterium]|nr:thioredoxin [Planctomycetota bacterium]